MMNDYRHSYPNLDLNTPSRRASASSQGTTGQRHQGGSNRSSGSARLSTSEEHARVLEQQLSVTKKQLKAHELRSAETDQRILALATQLKRVHDERILAIQEAAKANEELKLYKIRLEEAHKEIRRAQQIIDRVDEERYLAEKDAAEARSLTRKCRRDLLMMKAMEEGRKLGLQEGIEQGRALALQDGDYDDVGNEYLDYNESLDYRPRSLLLPPKEEIRVHPPEPSLPTPPTPPPPTPPPLQPLPVPPPELVQPIPETTPRPFRSPSPSVYHSQIHLPPDGYIPTVDENNIIRLPPPHELARLPPTPERGPSPQLPDSVPDVLQEGSRPNSRSQHRRRLSASSFASTSSYNGGRQQPLSAIPEVQSPYTSPLPQTLETHILRHQPSQASTHHSNAVIPEGGRISPQPSISISRRPSISSNVSRHPRSSSVQEDHRKSTTSSSAPGITVVPPSRPLSSATTRSHRTVLDDRSTSREGEAVDVPDVPVSISLAPQLFGTRRIGDSQDPFGAVPSPRASPTALPIPVPGGYQESVLQTPRREQSSPAPSNRPRMNDETMSIRSGDTLTTPQIGRRSHHRRTSLDSTATGWEDVIRAAGSPIPVPHHVLSSRPESRSTNRG